MPRDAFQLLQDAQYISFATLKRSGEYVATPVWFAPAGDSVFLFSAGAAGKIKRLRNFSQSRIAVCTATGKVTGDWQETEAFVLDQAEDIDTALQALRRKYGWKMRIGDCASQLTGKMAKRAYIRIDPIDG